MFCLRTLPVTGRLDHDLSKILGTKRKGSPWASSSLVQRRRSVSEQGAILDDILPVIQNSSKDIFKRLKKAASRFEQPE